jgi:ribosomal-protein-alanine N-acetyltransferase
MTAAMALLTRSADDISITATTLDLLDIEGRDAAELAARLGARPPVTWPPEHNDENTRNWMRNYLTEHPDEPAYTGWYIVGAGELVGTAGFKGPPNAAGEVEIGYGIIEARQRRGFASGAARILIDFAFSDPRVTAVLAETLPFSPGSQAVLKRCDFSLTGSRVDAEDGEVLCFRRNR